MWHKESRPKLYRLPSHPDEKLSELLGSSKLAVISNREPYVHQRTSDGELEVSRPAGGVTAALDPVLQSHGGLWIAHGSGSGDWDVLDRNQSISVPEEDPKYQLQRVKLSQQEVDGHYYGFSNEGLWPLCHLAYVKPRFRHQDWMTYQKVNEKFCDQTPESLLMDDSVILIQDYHFSLLPQLLRQRAQRLNSPGAKPGKAQRIALFWHIPWPGPEIFQICPWGTQILRGMLGSDLIGFHTQEFCDTFLECCDRYLEAQVSHAEGAVTVDGHTTLVRPFPIGIGTRPVELLDDDGIEELKDHYNIQTPYVAVGVDRIDYTKGLVERARGVERFFELYPEYIGKFTLAQIGSPSRTDLEEYQHLRSQLDRETARINARFGNPATHYQPILMIDQNHEWEDLQYFYQLGDACLVTSLHDGMNLVAKEYVWCQRDNRGSLILSRFTGASRELKEAIQVNPYSADEIAHAIKKCLEMPESERMIRMERMKTKVRNNNSLNWVARLISTLIEETEPTREPAAPQVEASVSRRTAGSER